MKCKQEPMNTVRYRISPDDIILEVNESWVDFAAANGAPELGPIQVLGQPLWRFISGVEVRHLYTLLLGRIRRTHSTVVIPFRCDAPDLRRFMEMTMTALPDGTVEFIATLIRTESRDVVSFLAPGSDRGQPLLTICSWCKRVQIAETDWVEVEKAVARLGLFQRDILPQLTHGVCHTCYAEVLRELSGGPGEPSHGALWGK